MKRQFSLLLACAVLVLTGCEATLDPVAPHTWDIFPIVEGASRITLRIDSTYNTSGGLEDRYYKQETVGNTETDLAGRTIHRLLVDRSDVSNGAEYQWERDRVWALYAPDSVNGDYYVERIEENQKVRILKFPVLQGVSWNGNLLNQNKEQIFEYGNVDTTVTVLAGTFENCVMVVNKDERASFIQDTYAYEIYAPGIGLIKKYDRTKFYDKPGNGFNESVSYVIQEELVEIP
ncbi:MAG: hypothetical protein NWR72_02330 [Bacteroidia bacterium]|nr:hypothetical protein [Bacteroidia bacterium]